MVTKLDSILKEKGLKKIWLAEQLGVEPATVSRWVKGKNMPTDVMKRKIAKLLSVSVGVIFFDQEIDLVDNHQGNT